MQLQGVIKGKHIELFKETNMPDGSVVMLNIQPEGLSLEEKRKLADRLCGSWSKDKSLKRIFIEIDKKRHESLSREVNFDPAS